MFETGDFVQHFKGNVYQIVGQIQSGEIEPLQTFSLLIDGTASTCTAASKIKSGQWCFVYKSSDQKYWIRPCAEFEEVVTTQRFTKVS